MPAASILSSALSSAISGSRNSRTSIFPASTLTAANIWVTRAASCLSCPEPGCVLAEDLEVVERLGVMEEDFCLGFLADLLVPDELGDRVDVTRGGEVTEVCPDYEVVRESLFEEVWNIVLVLAGHVYV